MASTRSEVVHVVCFSWPFDRPRGRPRSGEPRSFFKKTLPFSENQPVFQSSSQDILQKNTSDYFEINPQSRTDGLRVFFSKKPLSLSKISPCSTNPLIIFYANLLGFFSNQHTGQLCLYLFFSKKNVWPVARAHGRARRTSRKGSGEVIKEKGLPGNYNNKN